MIETAVSPGVPLKPSFLRVSDDVHRESTAWLEKRVRVDGVRSVFLPAGRTPEGLYQLWEAERPAFLNGVRLLQIDEVLTGPQKGIFARFFDEHLPSYKVERIDRADQQADVAILGLGLNGHIAFHEPYLPETFFGGCVELTEITRRTLGLQEKTWGLTYGAQAFMNCQSILMVAHGASKKEVVGQLCARSNELPATALLKHRDFTLICDRAAAF